FIAVPKLPRLPFTKLQFIPLSCGMTYPDTAGAEARAVDPGESPAPKFRAPFRAARVAFECGVRQIVDHNVRIHAMALNQPFAFGAVDAELRGRSDSVVNLRIIRREPDFAAPGPHADNFAEAETLESFAKRFAVGSGVLIAQHDDMPAKGVLHVPARISDARLPVKPNFA